ncbi:YopT-type cysteine protease domain-containing protein [Vibrio hepatarius]|uniref:YopT-type cysteine protease domain-containing protein n=1 Tax=Vibrio hepatarius TaxID=171383 RepID=UPI002090FDFE|nr:YopT-type cysteine protease domain-containing protein [Vibrio hepatarius]
MNYNSIGNIHSSLGQAKSASQEVRVKNGKVYLKDKKASFPFAVSRVRNRHINDCKKLLISTLTKHHKMTEQDAKTVLKSVLADPKTVRAGDIMALNEYVKTASLSGLFDQQKEQLQKEKNNLVSQSAVATAKNELDKDTFTKSMLAKYPLTQTDFDSLVKQSIGDKALWKAEDKGRIEQAISRFVNMDKLYSARKESTKAEIDGLAFARKSSLDQASLRQKNTLTNFFVKIGLAKVGEEITLNSLHETNQKRKARNAERNANNPQKPAKKEAQKTHTDDPTIPKRTNFSKALEKLANAASKELRGDQPAQLDEMRELFISGLHSSSGESMLKKSYGATGLTPWTQNGILEKMLINKGGICFGLAAKWGKDTAINDSFFQSMGLNNGHREGLDEAVCVYEGQRVGKEEMIVRLGLIGINTDNIESRGLNFDQGELKIHALRHNFAESGLASGHAVATYSCSEQGKEKYAFFDPNFGEVTFKDKERLEVFSRDFINIVYPHLPAQGSINCDVFIR